MRGSATAGRLLAIVLLSGCASRGSVPEGPVMSPTGVVYEGGTPPTETRRSQTATLYLRQNRVDRALALALEGIAADSTNPIHYFLAGAAYTRMGQYAAADSMFRDAQRIYPAYEIDIEPERDAAWVQAFNAGIEAFDGGDWDGTITIWSQATRIYDLRPEAHLNLGSVLAADGRYPEAIDVYRSGLLGLQRSPVTRPLRESELAERTRATAEMQEALLALLLSLGRFAEAEPLLRERLAQNPSDVETRIALAAAVAGQGRGDEARSLYGELLAEGSLGAEALFSLGIQFFRDGDYEQAAECFRRLTDLQPSSRDAWFNYANSLFAAEAWEPLALAGGRLVELDPLGENAQLVTARAQLETGDRPGAVATLDRADQAPVHVEGLQMQRSAAATTVFGRVTGNVAEPGTSLALRFTFYGEQGQVLGADTLTLTAPSPEEGESFEVRFSQPAAAYRYELIP
ncbi:MAG: tetratricopeptide repeat protein [Gemmatimonadetes bacterium]|nr:tetratricopeptide repeat protein [Gemmatimonadota bacterium]